MRELRIACMWLLIACAGCSDAKTDDSSKPPAEPAPKGMHATAGASAEDSGSAATGHVGSGDAQGPHDPNAPGDVSSSSGGAGGSHSERGAGGAVMTVDVRAGNGSAGNGGPEETPPDACAGGNTDFRTDSANCGACGNACAAFKLATGPRWPVAITADATHVYWTTSGNEGAVMRAAFAGGSAEMLAATQVWPSAIVVDATSIYWSVSGTIMKMPLAGGMQTRLVGVDQQVTARALAIHGDDLYFVTPGDNDLGAVMKVPLAGGMTTVLTTDAGGDPYGIAIDDTHVYWANGASSSDRLVQKIALSGGAPVTLVPGAHLGFGLGLQAGQLYYATFGGSAVGVGVATIMRVSVDGGTPTMLASASAQPLGLAVDRTHVYWVGASNNYTFAGTPGTDGTVISVPLAGGASAPISTSEADPGSIVATGTRVCWANYSDDTIRCLARCADSSCE